MGYGRYVGRVGALAVARRIGVSIGVAVLVMATAVPMSTESPAVKLAASTAPCTGTDVTCALILGGTTVPTPDQAYLDAVRDHFVGPLYGPDIEYVPVTAPMTVWPATGVARIIWFVTGPKSVWGLGGPGWPDEPLWKLSGFFDPTFDQSVRGGVTDLEAAIAAHPNEHLVIFGYSQGAMIANREKQKLAEQYPVGTTAPDIEFVLIGDENLPNGGLAARFPGLYIPILDLTFNGPAPTDTQFHTTEDINQYDGFSDFPLYPLNLLATANAVAGILYVHPRDLESSVDDPGTIHTTTGDTDYYFHPTNDLPLFDPLRMIGVPEPVIDVVEPFFKVLVEQGYDRSIPPGEPTPARLIPPLNPVKVAGDLVDAVGEGVDNAAALVGLPKPPAVTHDDLAAPQRKVGGELATTSDRLNAAIGTVKSVTGDGRTIVRSARSENGSPAATASPARKTPVRDAVKNASGDIKKVVTKVSDSVKKALSGGNDGGDTGDNA
jgi:PE-PPE domain-containing protein